ncbi:MAG: hypothetical protein NW205_05790 [Hyphomicrobiaceae bacterium]|nr:hypothetical protein [Hyphomicrobiaceae bacterium]
MSTFIMQAALLLLAAYLLGAILGCLLRRALTAPAGKRQAASDAATPAIGATAKGAPGADPLPSRDPPEPVQPRIETVAQPVSPVAPAATPAQTARFERALSAGPQSPASPATGAAPTASASPAAPPAPTLAAAPDMAPATAPAAPRVVMPAASGTGGVAATSAPIAPLAPPAPIAPLAPITPKPADDLQAISGIDAGLAATLNKLGFTRYEHIAAWTAGDVARVNATIPGGLAGRHGWIEQARVLATGGQTAFSKARAAGASGATPASIWNASADPVAAPAPAPVMAAPAVAPPPVASPSAQAPADDLERISGIDAATARILAANGVTAFKQIAGWTAADVARIDAAIGTPGAVSRGGWIEEANILARGGETEYARRRRVGLVVPQPPPAAPAAAAAPAAPAAAAMATTSAPSATPSIAGDDLMRILGVDAVARDILAANGVTRFTQVANWSAQDMQRFDGLIGTGGRIARENWPAQAVALLQGADPAAVRDRAVGAAASAAATPSVPQSPAAPAGAAPATGEVVRPSRLAEAIRANQVKPAAEAATAAGAARPDLSSFRSVRSELLRGNGGSDQGRADDLKRIRGIGVLIEKKLNSLGVTRYEQIANWTSSEIDRISHMLDFKGRIERESWVEQARILASGGQTEFSRRIDK